MLENLQGAASLMHTSPSARPVGDECQSWSLRSIGHRPGGHPVTKNRFGTCLCMLHYLPILKSALRANSSMCWVRHFGTFRFFGSGGLSVTDLQPRPRTSVTSDSANELSSIKRPRQISSKAVMTNNARPYLLPLDCRTTCAMHEILLIPQRRRGQHY
jgi:hypothetical protein